MQGGIRERTDLPLPSPPHEVGVRVAVEGNRAIKGFRQLSPGFGPASATNRLALRVRRLRAAIEAKGRGTSAMIDMRKGKCAICGHGKVLQAPAFEFYGEGGFFQRPSSVTFEKSAFLAKSVTKIAPLTMYVCR